MEKLKEGKKEGGARGKEGERKKGKKERRLVLSTEPGMKRPKRAHSRGWGHFTGPREQSIWT